MHDFSDRSRTGISILTSAAEKSVNKFVIFFIYKVCSKLNANVILTALLEVLRGCKRIHLKVLNLSNKFC